MRIYTASLDITALDPTAGDGILVIKAPATGMIVPIQAGLTIELASHALIHAAMCGVDTVGPMASATTPDVKKHAESDAAHGCTLYGAGAGGLTTEPTAWTDPYGEYGGQAGYAWRWESPHNAKVEVRPSEYIALRLLKALAAAGDANAWITFGVLG